MRELNDDDFESAVAAGACLIDFHATWCGPCKAIAPHVERLASAHEGHILFAKVDVDASPNAAAKFGIRSVPTFVALKDGAVLGTALGADPRKVAELANALRTD